MARRARRRFGRRRHAAQGRHARSRAEPSPPVLRRPTPSAFPPAGAAGNDRPVSVGAVTTMSSDGFSSPPSAVQTSAKDRSSGGGNATLTGTGSPSSARRSGEHVLRQRLVTQEAPQQRGEQSMLVLGSLCPRRDEIGQLEVARRQMPGPDPVSVVFVEPSPLAAAQIFPDVVQVDVDGGGVASAGPFLGGCVEGHLDLRRVNGFAFDQCPQRVIDLRYHFLIVPCRRAAGIRARVQLRRQQILP